MSIIYVRGWFDNFNSYGILASSLVEGLLSFGHSVRCIPVAGTDFRDKEWRAIRHPVLSPLMVSPDIKPPWELCIMSPHTAMISGGSMSDKVVRLTMFESPRLDTRWVKFENTCMAMILPCEGNVVGFQACGVHTPMYTIPLGYDDSVYTYSPLEVDGKCVFGIGGRIHPITDKRKGTVTAVELFRRAFPNEQDVELQVKTLNCDPLVVDGTVDSRVKVINELYSKEQLAEWYRGLTAYLSLSKSEGWGLMQHEAMVTGRPIISTRFLGLKEFVVPECMYEVGYDTEEAKIHPDGFRPGVWSKPNEDDVISAMRAVYCNRDRARQKGMLASKMVRGLTWNHAAGELVKVLKDLKLV